MSVDRIYKAHFATFIMDTRQLIGHCREYFSGLGYLEKEARGLLNPKYPDAFNPCAGHAEITQLANSTALENPVRWTTIEPVFRHLDAEKVSSSKYRPSFFEMLTYVDASRASDSSRERVVGELIGLYKSLGIDVGKLFVTIFDGYEGIPMPPDEESKKIWTKFLRREKVKPLKGRSNFEYQEAGGEQAGPRCEIFFDDGDGIFEIGTVVFDSYVYKSGEFQKIPNAIFGGAVGIERLEMTVNDYDSIWQTGHARDVLEVVKRYASGVGDLRFLEEDLLITADSIKSSLLIMAEGQEPTNKTRRGQRLRRLINNTRRSLERLNIGDYSELCSEISQILERDYGSRYRFYQKVGSERLEEFLERR